MYENAIKLFLNDIKILKENLPNNMYFNQTPRDSFRFRLKYNDLTFEIKSHLEYPNYPPNINILKQYNTIIDHPFVFQSGAINHPFFDRQSYQWNKNNNLLDIANWIINNFNK